MKATGPAYRHGNEQIWAVSLQRETASWIGRTRVRQSGRVNLENARAVPAIVSRSCRAPSVENRGTISSQRSHC